LNAKHSLAGFQIFLNSSTTQYFIYNLMTKEIFDYKKHSQLQLINLAEFFSHLGAGLITPVYYLFTESIGGDAFESGYTYGLFLMVHAFAIGLFARNKYIIDNKKQIILLSYILQLLSGVLYLFVSNVFTLSILQIFLAIQSSLYATVFHSYYATMANGSSLEDSTVWSLWNISTYLGLGISSILGGYIAESFGFLPLFQAIILFSTVSFLISLKFDKNI
jgi:predicted MFS family arabinose efflux permease